MIEKETNKIALQKFDKLSIQVSLNGLSFCVLDTISNSIKYSDRITFEKERSPYGMQKGLVALFEKHNLAEKKFADIIVIHRNNLFSLVPKSLFSADDLANYLKFNTKILASDLIVYDEIESYDMMNVYVPFVNTNNYIYEKFGEFTFKHNGTIMVETLLGSKTNSEPICYVHVENDTMEVTVIANKKLLFYNSFHFRTKEDFLYYLLFTMEQLKLDSNTTELRLFGSIEEGDELYSSCYEYINRVSIFVPPTSSYPFVDLDKETIDFTVLNAL